MSRSWWKSPRSAPPSVKKKAWRPAAAEQTLWTRLAAATTHEILPPLLLLLMMMMMKMKTLTIICAFMGMTAAQPQCDPLTQYARGDQCCKMCGPGTSMLSHSSCEEPQCKECGANQYQEGYTTKDKCEFQPYCSISKNFQPVVNQSKKKQYTCLCLLGYHCSSETCITCVPHTLCNPGSGAVAVGNHTHDTVCQECPKGSFSNELSWKSSCQKWTECESGYQIQQSGTDTSDNICVRLWHITLAVTVTVVIIVLVIATIILVRREDTRRRIKDWIESCPGQTWEPPREAIVPMTPDVDIEKEPMFPEGQISQEEGGTRTPEENEDELSGEMSMDPNRTENGNYVGQEMGKTETLSRQESQTEPLPRQESHTQTFTNSSF